MTDELVKRLDGRAQFFDAAPEDAARSNLRKSSDLFREAARRIEALEKALRAYVEADDTCNTLRIPMSIVARRLARAALEPQNDRHIPVLKFRRD